MEKTNWDKLTVIATFIQIVVIGGFTAFVTYNTSVMNNRIDSFKTGLEENTMIAKLVTELTADTVTSFKTDFALLSLERYLRSSQKGELKDYDRKMLIGFAKSIIMDRLIYSNKNSDSANNVKQIFIEKEFLNNIDTAAYNNMLAIISSTEKKSNLPDSAISNTNIANTNPVVEMTDISKSKAISALFNKTCYIQYSGDANKTIALKMQQNLKDAGWYAPGIEQVKGSYTSVIKYFHAEDQQLAEKVAALAVNSSGIKNIKTIAIKAFTSKVPVGQLEIWIGGNN